MFKKRTPPKPFAGVNLSSSQTPKPPSKIWQNQKPLSRTWQEGTYKKKTGLMHIDDFAPGEFSPSEIVLASELDKVNKIIDALDSGRVVNASLQLKNLNLQRLNEGMPAISDNLQSQASGKDPSDSL